MPRRRLAEDRRRHRLNVLVSLPTLAALGAIAKRSQRSLGASVDLVVQSFAAHLAGDTHEPPRPVRTDHRDRVPRWMR